MCCGPGINSRMRGHRLAKRRWAGARWPMRGHRLAVDRWAGACWPMGCRRWPCPLTGCRHSSLPPAQAPP